MYLYGKINGLTIAGREMPRRDDGAFVVPDELATEDLKRAFDLVEVQDDQRRAVSPRDEKRGMARGPRA